VAVGSLRGFVRGFACNMDHCPGGVGGLSCYHVECNVPGRFGRIADRAGISFPVCVDDPGFDGCRHQSFVVSFNLAVRSCAARSIVYEK